MLIHPSQRKVSSHDASIFPSSLKSTCMKSWIFYFCCQGIAQSQRQHEGGGGEVDVGGGQHTQLEQNVL